MKKDLVKDYLVAIGGTITDVVEETEESCITTLFANIKIDDVDAVVSFLIEKDKEVEGRLFYDAPEISVSSLYVIMNEINKTLVGISMFYDDETEEVIIKWSSEEVDLESSENFKSAIELSNKIYNDVFMKFVNKVA